MKSRVGSRETFAARPRLAPVDQVRVRSMAGRTDRVTRVSKQSKRAAKGMAARFISGPRAGGIQRPGVSLIAAWA